MQRLAAIPDLKCTENVPLSSLTRFAIGGPARILADASSEAALEAAWKAVTESSTPHALIGGGSNLVADDAGFPGIVLRYTANRIEIQGPLVRVAAGAVLQDLVDATVAAGLEGLHTMTGIPGWVGGAIYGNAGAYGHSIHEFVESVRFFDGLAVLEIANAACEFRYRESVFKRHKNWIVLDTTLRLTPGDAAQLRSTADGILKIRNEKYPPTMHCAGSIFKNLLLAELPASVRAQVPERVIREGKVPSAYFLQLAGAKGMVVGGVQVADYHANLIYNAGGGTARQVRELIRTLKQRVLDQSGLQLEEEVQYLGFGN
ncbi:MAG TPA: UDP-N-acetylmuramate dehydrogenase [Bryobacteraceae bacterium]|nr:UDP-N-acetylmuramate dehydrogenase [Bryobacteraceae bacterium]